VQRIIFRIDQDGNVTEEVDGVSNGTCLDITKHIEEKLGKVENRSLKPEFYQQQNVTLHQNQNQDYG